MDFRRSFALGVAWRVVAIAVTLTGLVFSIATPDLAAARIVAALLVAAAIASLWRHVSCTNIELARFVEAVGFGDLSQSFTGRGRGGGFDALGKTLNDAIRRLREERGRIGEEARYHAALVDEAPVALLTVDEAGRVSLANKAARRMFGPLDGVAATGFARWGKEFVEALAHAPPGRRVIGMIAEEAPQRAMLSVAQMSRLGGGFRVIAVEPIQRELAAVELATQADLVRVLTHEIMNSMTPVTSLAQTAAKLIAAIDHRQDPAFADARAAIDTLVRRAEGIMHFVESYRAFSRKPTVQVKRFAAATWAAELRRLFAASSGLALEVTVEPADLQLDADPDLLSQVVINLLKNAAEAAVDAAAAPVVRLEVTRLPQGRTRVAVSDNGAGIPETVAEDIFLPFFTTKSNGTGVGLSLARQIVIAHGGAITAGSSAEGGARFDIILK